MFLASRLLLLPAQKHAKKQLLFLRQLELNSRKSFRRITICDNPLLLPFCFVTVNYESILMIYSAFRQLANSAYVSALLERQTLIGRPPALTCLRAGTHRQMLWSHAAIALATARGQAD